MTTRVTEAKQGVRGRQLGRILAWAVALSLAGWSGMGGEAVWGQAKNQTVNNAGKSVHSPTTLAWELQQKNQVALISAAAEEARGKPEECLFKAQEIFAKWSEYKKSRAQQTEMSGKYLAYMNDYLNGKPQNIDGRWALEHAKFVFAALGEPVITRLEYWNNAEKDRRLLEPMAKLAASLLKIAGEKIETQLAYLETDAAHKAYPTDDAFNAAYMKVYSSKLDASYNAAWGQYFLAMSMDPARDAGGRNKYLAQAAASLQDWADGPDDSGVKFQSLLLRGKVYSESGKTAEAIKDLTAATQAVDEASKPIDWVRYQAHYQLVVAQMRKAQGTGKATEFAKPNEELGNFKKWIGENNNSPEALLSADMLGYRIAAAQASVITDAGAQAKAREDSLKILADLLAKNPKIKELIFEQLATQISDDQPLDKLPPLQLLAVAWSQAQVPDEPTDQMKKSLKRAMDAAELIRKNKQTVSPADYQQATLVMAIAADRLQQYLPAAKLNLEYIRMVPGDPRVKELAELTLSQLFKLRKGGINTPEIQSLNLEALTLLNKLTGNDKRYQYAQGLTLLENGKTQEARLVFLKIAKGEPNYYEAQYQLVLVAVQKVSELAMKGANPGEQKAAARDLLAACTSYLEEYAKAPEEMQKKMESTLIDLRLIQISTAISPLEDAHAALKGIEGLEKEIAAHHLKLDDKQQAGILRYRIISYSKLRRSADVAREIQKLDPKEAPTVIKNLVWDNQREIDGIEKSDPARARELATTISNLLDELIKLTKEPKDLYIYRQWRADMLVRSGKYDESLALWNQLRNENNQDLANDMGAARAMYYMGTAGNQAGQLPKAEDYFMRILPKLPAGSDSYWEAYLRIIQCREAQNKSTNEIRDRLRDLKAGDEANFGGKLFKREYQALASKYGI